MPHPTSIDYDAEFGGIDIYLFDQLQRGRIVPGMRVFDAGCGWGRNIIHLAKQGYDVSGVDADAGAIREVHARLTQIAPGVAADRFRLERVQDSTFADACADVVISSAVLHFARDDAEFEAMLRGAWRHLAPRGLFFCRLASTIGMEARVRPLGGRRFTMPDGTDRYLVDERLLLEWTQRLGARLLDPIKTTVVQDQRSMTTWVLMKS
jgi:2-polyprenyl-3-methyl-5-hydroxy-6-metoxy-1,4-benzoquinol methylase